MFVWPLCLILLFLWFFSSFLIFFECTWLKYTWKSLTYYWEVHAKFMQHTTMYVIGFWVKAKGLLFTTRSVSIVLILHCVKRRCDSFVICDTRSCSMAYGIVVLHHVSYRICIISWYLKVDENMAKDKFHVLQQVDHFLTRQKEGEGTNGLFLAGINSNKWTLLRANPQLSMAFGWRYGYVNEL